jgi:hypothetical protein
MRTAATGERAVRAVLDSTSRQQTARNHTRQVLITSRSYVLWIKSQNSPMNFQIKQVVCNA